LVITIFGNVEIQYSGYKGGRDVELAVTCLLGLELQIWCLYLECLSKGIKWKNFQKWQYITLWWNPIGLWLHY